MIVVTGGCGFIGLNLLDRLLDEDVSEIRIVDDLSNSNRETLLEVLRGKGAVDGDAAGHWTLSRPHRSIRISLAVADVCDSDAAVQACKGADAVIHLAAQTGVEISLERPRQDVRQNVLGTHNYLEASRLGGVGNFVAASSLAVVGDAPAPQHEDRPLRPNSPYAAAKAAIEGYCSAYWHSFGLKTVALRFANVYGRFAWRKGSVVAAYCKRAMTGAPLIVDGDGGQTRDFVLAEDLAAVICDAALGRVDQSAGEVYGMPVNVATGVQTSILDLARLVEEAMRGAGIETTVVNGPARAVDVRVSAPDIGRLGQCFPSARLRPVQEGLPSTIQWFRDNWVAEAAA